MVTIAVDMMGGDYGLSMTLPGSLSYLVEEIQSKAGQKTKPETRLASEVHQPTRLLLVGDQSHIESELAKFLLSRPFKRYSSQIQSCIEIVHTDQVVAMDEKPSSAMRTKKRSSMRIALNLIKEDRAQAAVSAGNTGALVAISRYVLKTFPSIVRPSIVSKLPTRLGHCYMLDLGGNVDTSAEHLFQFACMGSLLCSVLDGVEKPKVGLLNIGEEEIKGNEQVQQASERLQKASWINYCGFVEADAIFNGEIDVVTCDGFVGNVALKSMEGAARFIKDMAKEEFTRSWLRKAMGLASLPLFRALKNRVEPSQYNGASLVGLKGNVVKSHGGTDIEGFKAAISVAVREATHDLSEQIGQRLAQIEK